MTKIIDYYLSLISPWSYLGHGRLINIANRHQAKINIWPVDFSVIFPSTGGVPLPKRSPQRKAYRLQELRRWRERTQLDLNLQPKHFPVSDKLAAAMVITLRQQNQEAAIAFAGACLRACWLEEQDISDRETLLLLAAENQLDGEVLLNKHDKAIETILSDSEKAIELGVFGAPSYKFGQHLFWGQDRLDFLDQELQK